MNTFSLPEYFDLNPSAEVQLYDYRSTEENLKSKVNLSQNTISFLQRGTKEIFTEQNPILIDSSKFLIMKSGNCLMTENLPSGSSYRSILLFFSDRMLLDFIAKHQLKIGNSTHHPSAKECAYDDFISSFVKSIEELNKKDVQLRNKILEAKFEEIMLYLYETKGADFLHFLVAERDDQIRHFLKVVENNKLNKLTLKELAFLCNMSLSTFKREFEKHFQESPSKWFLEKRLEHATYLLKSKSKRISDIYEEIGYETPSNFIQAFKAKYGLTPKQYQSQN